MDNLEKACVLSCEKWCNSFSEEEEFTFSKPFGKRMDKLVDKMRNNKYHKLTRNAIKMIVVAAIVLSIALTAVAFPGTRKYIIKQFQNYFSYTVSENVEAEEVEELVIGYVPQDFVLTEEYNENLCAYQKYMNVELWFSIFKNPLDTEINYNNANQEITEHNNIEYITFDNGEVTGIIWNNGEYVYRIDSNLSKNELLKIAYAVK